MNELRELYQEVILDHGRNPRNFRYIADADGEARGDNPLCGDRVQVFVKRDEAGRLGDVAFQGHGCAITTASASMMTELLKGRSEAEARRLFDVFHAVCADETFDPMDVPSEFEDEVDRLQVMAGVRQFPMRVKCATLPWHTFTAALDGKKTVTTE
ncbi:MAG: SUF system NifU family Fe-S cluster assembly protein [Alphaproteobacteria bacterium]|nr:SUF system NifU family Fe-S cluster assembly protein [Alphaproteobacteria bacterium]